MEAPGALPGKVLVWADTTSVSLSFWYVVKAFPEMGHEKPEGTD